MIFTTRLSPKSSIFAVSRGGGVNFLRAAVEGGLDQRLADPAVRACDEDNPVFDLGHVRASLSVVRVKIAQSLGKKHSSFLADPFEIRFSPICPRNPHRGSA
jgi:hypothetical protein